jgi:hypothetical protein
MNEADMANAEELYATSQLAFNFSHAFSDGPDFTLVRRQNCENSISLAKIGSG